MASNRWRGHLQTLEEAMIKLKTRIVIKENGCHIINENGVGKNPWINFDGKMNIASRAVWIYHNGSITNGLFVCHKCNNPRCVNIDHLFLGTKTDNMHDAKLKGRNHIQIQKGEQHGRAILTEAQVKAIRKIKPYYGFAQTMAKEFGVSVWTIYQVIHNKNWKDVK